VTLPKLNPDTATTILGVVGAVVYTWQHAANLDAKHLALACTVAVFGYLTNKVGK
jgi:hypothetical protein